MVVVAVVAYSGCSETAIFWGSGSTVLGGVNVGGGGGCVVVVVDCVVVVWGTEEELVLVEVATEVVV